MKRLAAFLLLVLSVTSHAAEQPKLLVVLSVDQMRYDYLVRFRPWFSSDGFNRFLDRGATYSNALYTYGVTYTGPGHATIGSGREPRHTGIVGNLWFEHGSTFGDRTWNWYYDDTPPYLAPGASAPTTIPARSWVRTLALNPRYCTYDESVSATAGNTSGMSPANLMTKDGLGDAMKKADARSRVIGIALKDRSAILMAGRSADAAYWFDTDLPGFISSTWYRFNPGVFSFNSTLPRYMPPSGEWTLSGTIPENDLERVTFDPPEAWPLKRDRYGSHFPHPVRNYKHLTYTPAGNDIVADFALHVLATENLGAGPATDLLMVSFTSTDYIGHDYGPDSREAAETMVLLDRTLARFFAALDQRFGERYAVALSSDHAVQHNPLVMKLRDPDADTGRFDLRNAPSDATSIAQLPPKRLELERRIARKLRIRFDEGAPISHALLAFFEEPGFYLNWRRVDELKIGRLRVLNAVRDAVLAMKSDGVADAWTAEEFRTPNAAAGTTEALMRRSFVEGRSPDVIIALRPGWMWGWGSNSTSHGQPVEDDRHVPLLFWGAAFKPGIYEAPASPVDLARTMGSLVGVDAGGPDSRRLECLR